MITHRAGKHRAGTHHDLNAVRERFTAKKVTLVTTDLEGGGGVLVTLVTKKKKRLSFEGGGGGVVTSETTKPPPSPNHRFKTVANKGSSALN